MCKDFEKQKEWTNMKEKFVGKFNANLIKIPFVQDYSLPTTYEDIITSLENALDFLSRCVDHPKLVKEMSIYKSYSSSIIEAFLKTAEEMYGELNV